MGVTQIKFVNLVNSIVCTKFIQIWENSILNNTKDCEGHSQHSKALTKLSG